MVLILSYGALLASQAFAWIAFLPSFKPHCRADATESPLCKRPPPPPAPPSSSALPPVPTRRLFSSSPLTRRHSSSPNGGGQRHQPITALHAHSPNITAGAEGEATDPSAEGGGLAPTPPQPLASDAPLSSPPYDEGAPAVAANGGPRRGVSLSGSGAGAGGFRVLGMGLKAWAGLALVAAVAVGAAGPLHQGLAALLATQGEVKGFNR
jgi:hypothetical protein